MFRNSLAAALAAAALAAAPALAGDLPAARDPRAQQTFELALDCSWRSDTDCALDALALARRLDPLCALCAWLEARVLAGDPEREEAAIALLADAERLAAQEGGLPFALVAALRLRLGGTDERAGRAAEAIAMAGIAARFPRHHAVQIWAAEALAWVDPARARALAEAVLGERPPPHGPTRHTPPDPRHAGALRLLGRAVTAAPQS